MEQEEIRQLFKKYHEGRCTEAEKGILEAWYLEFNEHEIDLSPKQIKALQNQIFLKLPGDRFRWQGMGLKLLAAVTLIGIAIALISRLKSPEFHTINKPIVQEDISPGTNTAMLTLSGGQKINLNQAVPGRISGQAGINIIKTASGQITYQAAGTNPDLRDNVSNQITVPAGGQWQVVLPDGSKVWLNSCTTLTYPISFEGQKSRIVTLTGEGYFEIAKDKSHPFVVRSTAQDVQVLGTHFDISAYPEEESAKTTLAEGSIKISIAGAHSRFLVPGQQAITAKGSLITREANLEEALAWKNGYFRFNDENTRSIMRKLARWYDIKVKYATDLPTGGLNGKISRYKNISQVLKALEATQTVHFKVEGRSITVMK